MYRFSRHTLLIATTRFSELHIFKDKIYFLLAIILNAPVNALQDKRFLLNKHYRPRLFQPVYHSLFPAKNPRVFYISAIHCSVSVIDTIMQPFAAFKIVAVEIVIDYLALLQARISISRAFIPAILHSNE